MDKAAKLIKPYLKRFILQIHPDYFQLEPIKKQTNATSLQKLNDIFSDSKAIRSPLSDKTVRQPLQLEFYLKKQRQTNADNKVIIAFGAQDSEWSKIHTFFQLCQKAGLPVLDADMETVQAMLQKMEEANKSHHKKMTLTEEFAKNLYKQYSYKSTTLTTTITKEGQQEQQQQWQMKDILDNELIMFGPLVNKETMAKELCLRLPKLMPERWWGKHGLLVVSPTFEVKPTKGIIVLRANMNLEDMQKCIKEQTEAR
ncbi:hypothetical protein BDF20DRAFT_912568 [Mycotypha africana]|uniref:uncharacterized protein n=1 Tax=Mycotypha africana TaxID=64632 RepID=UPI002301D09A|nr:uncharacterized protein BDF20DRAFT_912568 [Mycotypha africana]KAI8982402.1 hypothetical protein BDF20DRAFT_912568 [Mycotypha africana]